MIESKKCKYCVSEMELMEDYPNHQEYECMNEECGANLSIDEQCNYDLWEIK